MRLPGETACDYHHIRARSSTIRSDRPYPLTSRACLPVRASSIPLLTGPIHKEGIITNPGPTIEVSLPVADRHLYWSLENHIRLTMTTAAGWSIEFRVKNNPTKHSQCSVIHVEHVRLPALV